MVRHVRSGGPFLIRGLHNFALHGVLVSLRLPLLGGDMQPQSIASEKRSLLPLCPSCGAPMRIRTIGVIDRREDVRFACTACDTETVRSYKLGD
jgi:predicted RNA-binding Zn-ribbon protein involved in translation (DUF1610 family)